MKLTKEVKKYLIHCGFRPVKNGLVWTRFKDGVSEQIDFREWGRYGPYSLYSYEKAMFYDESDRYLEEHEVSREVKEIAKLAWTMMQKEDNELEPEEVVKILDWVAKESR